MPTRLADVCCSHMKWIEHTTSSAAIGRGGLDSSIRSLPRSEVLWSTQPNSDDGEPHVQAADGDSGVCAAFPMHDAPVVQRLEAQTLNYTRKTALGHVLVRASPNLKVLHVAGHATRRNTPYALDAKSGHGGNSKFIFVTDGSYACGCQRECLNPPVPGRALNGSLGVRFGLEPAGGRRSPRCTVPLRATRADNDDVVTPGFSSVRRLGRYRGLLVAREPRQPLGGAGASK
ncbi:hypothetical protein HPB51_016798 [Rhipicephalus microplus]|uniref:Uncharacterized protein n=1 Tax=Rhipicephalus microplus TaxID=6941 RepID=A0A9J6DVG3_RHIMP|nr:hypothetical protein HPB51_016798 [Rhipicephalus microplus]